MRKAAIAFIAVALASSVLSSSASASTQSGTIQYSSADQTYGADGVATIRVIGAAPVNKPACAIDGRLALNLTSTKASGQYLYALILSAMSSGWQVTVTGTGQCSTVPSMEDLAYIEVTKP